MANSEQQFHEFLRHEVNLNKRRYDDLESHVNAVNSWLKGHLNGYQRTERQGSWALGTLIKPVDTNDEYDADVQVVMNPNPNWEPKDYVQALYNALQQNRNYADKIKRNTRCVTVNYAGDFHLDVVPRVTIKGNHYICNRVENEFQRTDGTSYRDWFSDKDRIAGGNLRRVVRLLKFLRDHKNNYTAKSILLTTLVGTTISASDEGTPAVSSLENTLITVLTRMDNYLQQNPVMPEIRNPVLSSETFNRHWDQVKYANFRERVHSHLALARQAMSEPSTERSFARWQGLFGDAFGKPSSGSSSTGNNGTSSSSSGGPGRNLVAGAATPIVRQRGEAPRFG